MSIPQTMLASVVQESKTVQVQEVPVPVIADNEILIKVVAVAQNPTDWKHVDYLTKPGTIIGCDYSGTVVQVGRSATGPAKEGDHVAGFVQGGHWFDRGAFAEYVKTTSDLVYVVPPGTFSHDEAATTGCGLWTAAQALFHPTRLGLVAPPLKLEGERWIFVYGGSTSVGAYAVQLAHIAGYKVATVASPHNHVYVKELGADVVVDYNLPDAAERLRAAASNSIHNAIDAHSSPESQLFTVRVLAPGPGKVVVFLEVDETAKKEREDAIIQTTLIYTSLGREFLFMGRTYDVVPEDKNHMAAFLRTLTELVKDKKIKPNKVKVWADGLKGVPEGFEYMKAGKVSAEKLVYRVSI